MVLTYDQELMNQYESYLLEEEKSHNTIQKYVRDVKNFLQYCMEKELDKKLVLCYKEDLINHYQSTSVNSILAGINHFLKWKGHMNLCVKPMKIQRILFENPQKEITKLDYEQLIRSAKDKGDERLVLLLQTICSTGIRVSELQYITVESLAARRSEVSCKGKNRVIFLPKELCKSLRQYCNKNNIEKGAIFITSTGKILDRSNIWKMMKSLSKESGVLASKIFPHNLRHLFAKTFYQVSKDISKLADLLGHSSIETTRIYTKESGEEHCRQLETMGLTVSRSGTT